MVLIPTYRTPSIAYSMTRLRTAIRDVGCTRIMYHLWHCEATAQYADGERKIQQGTPALIKDPTDHKTKIHGGDHRWQKLEVCATGNKKKRRCGQQLSTRPPKETSR